MSDTNLTKELKISKRKMGFFRKHEPYALRSSNSELRSGIYHGPNNFDDVCGLNVENSGDTQRENGTCLANHTRHPQYHAVELATCPAFPLDIQLAFRTDQKRFSCC
ncbi:hypothetical protein AB6A40_008246 [Gnathostoma spinigerum]|uniref:Uncharacterized protein n=1 Tax=Gnathostoma spinigerum TaxID=75299 RepID=A0ABD6EQW4_9BILA